MPKKYVLTNESIKYDHRTLYRIKRCSDGLSGGFVQSEENLSHNGNCWIHGDSKVYDNAKVCENATIYDEVKVFHKSLVRGNAQVYNTTQVLDSAEIRDNARIFGNSLIYMNSQIGGNVTIDGNYHISLANKLFGNILITGKGTLRNLDLNSREPSVILNGKMVSINLIHQIRVYVDYINKLNKKIEKDKSNSSEQPTQTHPNLFFNRMKKVLKSI
jgi:carbonic anhydrase/acetyltransferase-like protein (isoleucine patch superfamily)